VYKGPLEAYNQKIAMPSRSQSRSGLIWSCVLLSISIVACQRSRPDSATAIIFKHVPQPDIGGIGTVDTLSGTVRNYQPGTRLVVYVYSRGSWYVQPLTLHPFTTVENDGAWSTLTHLGSQYAAVLVMAGYHPANVLRALPPVGGSVLFLKTVPGDPSSVKPPGHLVFSSYDWNVRQIGSDRYGTPHEYRMSNVSLDAQGYLHLRVTRETDKWTCAEVALRNGLGYGRYDLVVSEVEKLEPATVFDVFTSDEAGTDENHREMNTQLARWGDPDGMNAEFSVQPYYRPANNYRYSAPKVPLMLTLYWESGRAKFDTSRVSGSGRNGRGIAEHTFTSEIPGAPSESVHLNLCVFDYGKMRETSDAEVVVRSFHYLP
jgi:hypothetical protein